MLDAATTPRWEENRENLQKRGLPYNGSLNWILSASYFEYYDDASHDFSQCVPDEQNIDDLSTDAANVWGRPIKYGAAQFNDYRLIELLRGGPRGYAEYGIRMGKYQHPETKHIVYLTLQSDG